SALLDRQNDLLSRNLTIASTPQLIEESLERTVEIFEFIWQNRRTMQLLLSGGRSAQFTHLIDEFAERSRANTKRVLEWGMQRGLYRPDLDIELTSLVTSGAYDRIARQLVASPTRPELRAWLTSAQRIILRGILSREALPFLDGPVKKGNQ